MLFIMTHKQFSIKGGKAGRGLSKTRTKEQCRKAALAMWANKRLQTMGASEVENKLNKC